MSLAPSHTIRADLHVHSTASDGSTAPSELVRMAAESDLLALALTDHDSVEGITPAVRAAQDLPLELIPAVELSAYRNGVDVHILGYYIDHTDPDLGEALLALRHARLDRALQMIDSLSGGGFDISAQDVLALASGGAVGRSHIARALVHAGHAADIQDAFDRYIGSRRPHYVRKPLESPVEVVARIRAAGGAAVLAHPALGDAMQALDELVDAGLAGLEALHTEHTPGQAAEIADAARERGLIVTGGSDFHGVDRAGGRGTLGADLPAETLDRLADAARG